MIIHAVAAVTHLTSLAVVRVISNAAADAVIRTVGHAVATMLVRVITAVTAAVVRVTKVAYGGIASGHRSDFRRTLSGLRKRPPLDRTPCRSCLAEKKVGEQL